MAGALLTMLVAAMSARCVSSEVLPSLAGEEPSSPPPDHSKWLRVRGLAPDDTGQFTQAFRELGDEALNSILDVVDHFEDVVSDSNCVLRDEVEWGRSIPSWVVYRGWRVPSSGCKSSTAGVRQRPLRLSGEEVFERLRRMGEVSQKVMGVVYERTVKRLERGEWFDSTVATRSFDYSQGRYEVCKIERATALRVLTADTRQPVWYVLQGFTNGPLGARLPDWGRKYVTEFTGVSVAGRRFVAPLWQSLKPAGAGNESVSRAPFRTALESWPGATGMSAIMFMEIGDAPALAPALEVTGRDIDQAKDALTLSNIAYVLASLPRCCFMFFVFSFSRSPKLT